MSANTTFPPWEKITKERVFALQTAKEDPNEHHRWVPCRNNGIQDRKKNGGVSFSVSFCETIIPLLEVETGVRLIESKQYGNYYKVLSKSEEERVRSWVEEQGSRIFLRDCLTLSLALDVNFQSDEHTRTALGDLEYRAKSHRETHAIGELSCLSAEAIRKLPFYRDADCICAVPPSPGKDFDLPSAVVKKISGEMGISDVTSGFVFEGEKKSLKSIPCFEKWGALEESGLSFDSIPFFDVTGKTVILVDDKYQSGITIQYVAMKLQEAGARAVYGLCFVKTLRDTDNT